MSKKIILGLDLGVAQHGWALLEKNENNLSESKIIGGGWHHLFSPEFNEVQIGNIKRKIYLEGQRGNHRRTRRTIKRKQNRKRDFKKGIYKYYNHIFNLPNDGIELNQYFFKNRKPGDIYEWSYEALSTEVDRRKLFLILYFWLGLRGVSYVIKKDKETKIIEKFLNTYKHIGAVRKKDIRNFKFSNDDLSNQLEQIIDNQSYLQNTNFKEWFLGKKDSTNISLKYGIFNRVRDYSQGPSVDLKSYEAGKLPVNKWNILKIYENEYLKNKKGEYEKYENIWDKNIAECPVYNSEKVCYKSTLSSDLSNFFSDLSRIKKNDKYLTTNEKKLILELMLKNQKINKNELSKLFNVKKEDIKYNFTIFKPEMLLEIISKNIFEFKSSNEILNVELIEKIDQISTLINDRFKIYEKTDSNIHSHVKNYDECKEEVLKIFNFPKIDDFLECNFWNSYEQNRANFSSKLYREYLSNSKWKTLSAEYSSQVFENSLKYFDFYHKYDCKFKKIYLNEKAFNNLPFTNPSIKNALCEATKIINKVLKIIKRENWILDAIVIETTANDASGLFSQNRKKEIEKYQEKFKLIKDTIKNMWDSDKYGKLTDKEINKLKYLILTHQKYIPWFNKNTAEKISEAHKLKNKLEFIDPYKFDSLYTWDEICSNLSDFEVDHIVPKTGFGDGRKENLTLTHSFNNSKKSNSDSCWDFIKKNNPNVIDSKIIEWLKESLGCHDNINIRSKSRQSTSDSIDDITNPWLRNILKNQKMFNLSFLNATSQTMSFLQRGLQYFFLIQHYYGYWKNVDIVNVNGETTQFIREKIQLPNKDRDDFKHHFEDAAIASAYGLFNAFRNDLYSSKKYCNVDDDTGEIHVEVSKTIFEATRNRFWSKDFSEEEKEKYFITNKYYLSTLGKVLNNVPNIEPKQSAKVSNLIKYKTVEEKINFVKNLKGSVCKDKIYRYDEVDGVKYKVEKLNFVKPINKATKSGIDKLNEIFSLDNWKDFIFTKDIKDKEKYFLKIERLKEILNNQDYFIDKKFNLRLYQEKVYNDLDNDHKQYLINSNIILDIQNGWKFKTIRTYVLKNNKKETVNSIAIDKEKIDGLRSSYKSNAITKCFYLYKDKKGNKRLVAEKFNNEAYEYLTSQNLKILDVWMMKDIFMDKDTKILYYLSGARNITEHIGNGNKKKYGIYLTKINGNENPLEVADVFNKFKKIF